MLMHTHYKKKGHFNQTDSSACKVEAKWKFIDLLVYNIFHNDSRQPNPKSGFLVNRAKYN